MVLKRIHSPTSDFAAAKAGLVRAPEVGANLHLSGSWVCLRESEALKTGGSRFFFFFFSVGVQH